MCIKKLKKLPFGDGDSLPLKNTALKKILFIISFSCNLVLSKVQKMPTAVLI